MVKTLLVLSLVLIVGVAGVTVTAAQSSQPVEPINAVKAWSEQTHTLLQTRSQVQATQMVRQSEADPGQQEHDRIRLQMQDMQQSQDRSHQSLNPGQQNQAGGNPWISELPTADNGYSPKFGQGKDANMQSPHNPGSSKP
jgi:hypothetical protein